MLFSIIIPVYNAEKTLEKCLDSILSQSFCDYEVILTDDGSKDRSLSICQAYCQKDMRFRVCCQENKGPSSARNQGMRRASGEYLCFVDSDDFIRSDYLEQMRSALLKTGADVLFFGFNRLDREGKLCQTRIPPTGLKGLDLAAELSARDMFGYTWIKCISRKLAEDTLFPEDITLFEDELFTLSIIEKANHVDTLPEALYSYVTGGADMLTGRTYQDYCVLSDRVFSAWERLMSNTPGGEAFLSRKANSLVARCRYYGLERDVDLKRFFGSLADTRFFRMHTDWTALDRHIRHGDWVAVKAAVLLYRGKNRLRGKK